MFDPSRIFNTFKYKSAKPELIFEKSWSFLVSTSSHVKLVIRTAQQVMFYQHYFVNFYESVIHTAIFVFYQKMN